MLLSPCTGDYYEINLFGEESLYVLEEIKHIGIKYCLKFCFSLSYEEA